MAIKVFIVSTMAGNHNFRNRDEVVREEEPGAASVKWGMCKCSSLNSNFLEDIDYFFIFILFLIPKFACHLELSFCSEDLIK